MKTHLTIDALCNKANKGAIILAEYQRDTEIALRSTEGKGMDCTKYAYGFGKECYANRGVFIELLKRERVLVGKKYEPQFHYHYVSRLFAKIAGITVNAGEISRIALVCMHVHGANIAPNELPAWFQQVGGLRKAYQLTVRQRADEPANDNDDLKLHFNVIGSNGFQGILDLMNPLIFSCN